MVEEVGAGVTGFKAGDAVYTMSRFPEEAGAYAEYASVPETDLAPKPESLDHVQAAAVPLVALTRLASPVRRRRPFSRTDRSDPRRRRRGSGTSPSSSRNGRARRVIGTASARNEAFLKEIGVDQVVDYNATDIADAVRDVDVQLDSLGAMGRERVWSVMKTGGIMVSIKGPVADDEAAGPRSPWGGRARPPQRRPA